MANKCCSREPRTVGLCPGGQSGADGEGSRAGGLGDWRLQPRHPPTPTPPLTWREMSQRARGSSSLGFLCGFHFCCHLRGQAVCGAVGNNCKNQNQIHWG